jgi:hypothetical protein
MQFPTCGSAMYTSADASNADIGLDGGRNIFFFGDNTTTGCSQMMMGQACMYGEADTSAVGDDMYANWGAGMGLQLAADSANPWDAATLGIMGVKFTVTGWSGRPVRVQLSQVDDPAITDASANYEENGFVWGGTSAMSIVADGDTTIMFTDFKLPEWTGVLDATGAKAMGQVVDAAMLHSLQFQIANNPPDMPVTYGFCVSNLQWVDSAGTAIPVGVPMDSGGGGAPPMGGMGTGGGMAGMGTGGAMGGMGTGGGMGGAGGDVPTFADVHAIFMAKCTPCHDDGMMSGGRSHGQMDAMAAYMSASMMPEVISDRINRPEGEMGHMPPAMAQSQLTPEEIATNTAWVDGGAAGP